MSTAECPDQVAASAARATLPRAARLLKGSDFNKVFKTNQGASNDLFRALWRANDCGGHRLGMAVSRKVDRSAVGRNRIKRIIREQFRRWRAATATGGRHYDVVVLPRPRAAQAGNAELEQALRGLWRRLGHERDAAGIRRATRKND